MRNIITPNTDTFHAMMVSWDFRRVNEIFDEIDVGPLEAHKKQNVLWEQCKAINQVCQEIQ